VVDQFQSQQLDSLPNSQKSVESAASSGSPQTLPPFHSSSSNVSASTYPDTASTSPISSSDPLSQLHVLNNLQSPKRTKEEVPAPPRLDTTALASSQKRQFVQNNGAEDEMALASPMSIDTPGVSAGSKRSADGTIKSNVNMSTEKSSIDGRSVGSHSRTHSLESNSVKISDVSIVSICCTR
jgi:hypothetical protein